MSLTLLLRLPALITEDTEWLLVDATGAAAGPRQRGPLALAAAASKGAKVVALAPATQVLLAEPELPPGGGAKLARAVPFALEEQLTEDIDQLFFAIGRRSAGAGTPVAVVSREVLAGWMSAMTTAGIEPVAIYADMALLPQNPSQTVLWLEQSRLAVRRPQSLPFAVELSPVTEALTIAGVIADPLDTEAVPKAPESALLYVTRDDWNRVQDEFEGLIGRFESLKVQILQDGPLPWLARELAATDAVNLLQGEFERATDYGARWRQWRPAAFLAAGLLVAHVGVQAVEIRAAKQESAALDKQIAEVFAAAMPSETPTDPRRQMQARLERIRKASAGPQHFLRSLQAVSQAASGGPPLTVDALGFREQTLDLKLTAPNIDAISHLSQGIVKQGLSADIQSSTPVANGIEAHLQIKPPAARAQR
jgi:general secretion pathway protein L